MKHYRSFRFTFLVLPPAAALFAVSCLAAHGNEAIAKQAVFLRLAQVQSTPASQEPSDEDIISATKDQMRRSTIQAIAADYGDLDHLSPDVLTELNTMGPETARPLVNCSLNAPQQRIACVNRVKSELLAKRAAEIRRAQDFDMGVFAFSVFSKTNYEGNYVAVVDVRKRGTDDTEQWKVSLQFRGGSWTAIDGKRLTAE